MNRRKMLILCAATMAALFALTSCGNTPATSQEQEASQQDGTHQISSQRAREIAVDFVGHGTAHDVLAFTDNGVLTFEVDVRHDAIRYVVLISAESGNVTRLSRYVDETAVATATAEPSNNLNVVPDYPPHQPTQAQGITSVATATATPSPTTSPQPTASPSVSGQRNRPSNPAISLDRAIEIAYADLASRGINATYRSNSGMDWERGQWVWELLFRTQGERMPFIEFYINVDNGNIVKFEWDD